MDKAARTAIVRIIAAMDDKEFADLTAEARGDTWTPGPADYRNLVAQLEGETRDKAKDSVSQSGVSVRIVSPAAIRSRTPR